MDNVTTSGSIEELKVESNLLIYIIGLILLIVWKITMMCQVRLHRKQPIGETGVDRASTATGASFMMYKTEYHTFLLSV